MVFFTDLFQRDPVAWYLFAGLLTFLLVAFAIPDLIQAADWHCRIRHLEWLAISIFTVFYGTLLVLGGWDLLTQPITFAYAVTLLLFLGSCLLHFLWKKGPAGPTDTGPAPEK